MKTYSHLAEALPRSGIREIMELASTTPGVIHLEVGEPSFDTPAHIVNAALADAHAGYTRYTPNAGLPSLRTAIAERATRAWGRPVSPSEVLVSTGAVGALATSILALCEDGDEVLIPDPGWPNYLSMVNLSRAKPVPYVLRPEDEYVPRRERLTTNVTTATKVLLINTPGNPTGAVIPGQGVRELVDFARSHDLFVISDEVYEELIFEGTHVSAGLFDPDRVVVISGCSKTYAMTGWRLGYAIANPALITLMAKLQEPLVSCASSVSQRAAEAALRGPQGVVIDMCDAYRRRRDLVWEVLGSSGLLATRPLGAFYAMVDLRPLQEGSRALALMLLEEERVATAPGGTFGNSADGMLRISLAADEDELIEGCRRIKSFAQRHQAVVPPSALQC
jgi:aspartate aminotransferase/aminotransferase